MLWTLLSRFFSLFRSVVVTVGMSCDITMLELRHLYSNLLPGPETLAELRSS